MNIHGNPGSPEHMEAMRTERDVASFWARESDQDAIDKAQRLVGDCDVSYMWVSRQLGMARSHRVSDILNYKGRARGGELERIIALLERVRDAING